jgi:hypothetical protein
MLSPVEIQIPTHWNLIGRSITSSTPYVIAQQYSSATFVSLRFHSLKQKFGSRFKNGIISTLFPF